MKMLTILIPRGIITRCAILASFLVLGGCEKKSGQTPNPATAADIVLQAEHTTPAPKSREPRSNSLPAASDKTLRFVTFNVENWLILEDRFDFETRQSSKNAPKPEKEKAAVIEILNDAQPDVLGLCEIGSIDDLKEIQRRLMAKGLDLPHLHHSGGVDSTRFLGLLSRYPIVTSKRHDDLFYRYNGKSYGMQRGILDATIARHPQEHWRFLGCHLKSKREVEEGSQQQMRIHEAQLLRKKIDQILRDEPKTRLIVYGDLNDTRMSPALRIIQGPYHSPRTMTALPLADSRGMTWTHYWAKEDVYSRIDYILFPKAFKARVIADECKILDPPHWNDASDHRAILGVFR